MAPKTCAHSVFLYDMQLPTAKQIEANLVAIVSVENACILFILNAVRK